MANQSTSDRGKPTTAATAASSGFKLPLPSPELPQDETFMHQEASQKNPPTSVFSSHISGAEQDSEMFSFHATRPGTRAEAYSSSFFAGSRLNTGIGISYDAPIVGGPGTGRPLTALTIPEETATDMDHLSPAASLAADYRVGKYRRGTADRAKLSTPVIELDEHLREAAMREEDMSEGASTPASSGKTEFE